MRPNSPYQQSLVSWRFRGDDVIVYAIREDKLHDQFSCCEYACMLIDVMKELGSLTTFSWSMSGQTTTRFSPQFQ